MEKLNKDSEWPKKKSVDGVEITEKEKDEWPSDYFECLKPVFMISEKLAETQAYEHRLKFKENKDDKELVTYLLLSARRELDYRFCFRELTLTEIQSLVKICKGLVREFSDNILQKPNDPLDPRIEVISHWLWENYAISHYEYAKLTGDLFDEDLKSGLDITERVSNNKDRWEQFTEYVRRTREKALVAKIK